MTRYKREAAGWVRGLSIWLDLQWTCRMVRWPDLSDRAGMHINHYALTAEMREHWRLVRATVESRFPTVGASRSAGRG